jgi:hypothetical protein
LEFADAREPASATGGRIILVRVPESDAVGGIDCGHAVIAPASGGMGLVAAARSHDSFALAEIIQRIGSQPARITNRRFLRRAGGGIADGHVPALIHRDAGHPAP